MDEVHDVFPQICGVQVPHPLPLNATLHLNWPDFDLSGIFTKLVHKSMVVKAMHSENLS